MKGGARTKRILKEIKSVYEKLKQKLVICWIVEPFKTIRFVLRGNPDSVYREGHFVVEVGITADYPFKCFSFAFLTPFYHPTVNLEGKICNCCYKEKWSPAKTMGDYLSDLLEAMKEPATGLQKYACVLRVELQS